MARGRLIDGDNISNGIALYLAENAYLFDTAQSALEMVANWVNDAPTVDAVVLPCKMGDEVWGLKEYFGSKIPKKGVVHQMYYGEDMRLCICVKNVCRGEWGRNVFATKEEAIAAAERTTDNEN